MCTVLKRMQQTSISNTTAAFFTLLNRSLENIDTQTSWHIYKHCQTDLATTSQKITIINVGGGSSNFITDFVIIITD